MGGKAETKLVYLESLQSGISRRQAGRGFVYKDAAGKRVKDPAVLDRINALGIPPAYRDVVISEDPSSHLQAIGFDTRGRKQYLYHPEWRAMRDQAKFERLLPFATVLPDIRQRVDGDLRKQRIGMEKAVATVVWMLDNLFIRIGNIDYVRTNGSYGLTTLRNRHVNVDGSRIRFRFRGKSGKEWNLVHTDRRIANVVRRLQDLPGQSLFQYLDDDGSRRPVSSHDVNSYIREISGEDFTSRQFRTWGATCMAVAALAPVEVADSERMVSRQINEAVDAVAAKLVNTRTVCRSNYIHPSVIEAFRAGTLGNVLALPKTRSRKLLDWMTQDEIRTLQWLKSR